MKLSDIKDIKKNKYDFAHLFKIYQMDDGSNYFNINKTIYIVGGDDMMPSVYNLYTVQYGDTWTNISYDTYGTIELWWMICKFNDIMDPTSLPIEGTQIKLPTKDMVDPIVSSMKKA